MHESLRILALDTASTRHSVALLEGRELRAEVRIHSSQTHSTLLLGSIRHLLDRAGWELRDLNLVTTGVGPGSFTGIRIGISTALGLSQSLGIPFTGISGLDALAHQAEWLESGVAALIDAHRNQYYFGEYIHQNGRLSRKGRPVLIGYSDLEAVLEDRQLYMVGDVDAARGRQRKPSVSDWPRRAPVDLFLAASMGRLAIGRKRYWLSGEGLKAEPMYIRPPDALRNKRKQLQ